VVVVVAVVVVAMPEGEVGIGVVLFEGRPRCSLPCRNGESVADGEDVECRVGGELCE